MTHYAHVVFWPDSATHGGRDGGTRAAAGAACYLEVYSARQVTIVTATAAGNAVFNAPLVPRRDQKGVNYLVERSEPEDRYRAWTRCPVNGAGCVGA